MYDIEELVADSQGLECLLEADLAQFPNLQALFIPHNKIRRLDNLQHNYRLCFLDARDNGMVEFDLSGQCYMRDLYLSGNRLQDLERVLARLAHMKDLQTLDLRGNPATLEKGYRAHVIARFATLKVLDGLDVPASARKLPKKVESAGGPPRPSSVLQYLLARPPSAADAIVARHADDIRRARELRRRKQEEEETAVARRRKEEFEEAARSRQLPLADALTRGTQRQAIADQRPRTEARAWQLFLKIPEFRVNDGLSDEEKLFVKQNPGIPTMSLTRRVSLKVVHPK
jgi:hypothetical protein